MPRSKDDSSNRGKLLIKFQVEFPPNQFASEEAIKRLATLLPLAPPPPKLPEGAEPEHVTLSDFDPAELHAKGAAGGRRAQAYDEDEEDDEPRQRSGPQCAAQ